MLTLQRDRDLVLHLSPKDARDICTLLSDSVVEHIARGQCILYSSEVTERIHPLLCPCIMPHRSWYRVLKEGGEVKIIVPLPWRELEERVKKLLKFLQRRSQPSQKTKACYTTDYSEIQVLGLDVPVTTNNKIVCKLSFRIYKPNLLQSLVKHNLPGNTKLLPAWLGLESAFVHSRYNPFVDGLCSPALEEKTLYVPDMRPVLNIRPLIEALYYKRFVFYMSQTPAYVDAWCKKISQFLIFATHTLPKLSGECTMCRKRDYVIAPSTLCWNCFSTLPSKPRLELLRSIAQ